MQDITDPLDLPALELKMAMFGKFVIKELKNHRRRMADITSATGDYARERRWHRIRHDNRRVVLALMEDAINLGLIEKDYQGD
jgi:hypothetical protein